MQSYYVVYKLVVESTIKVYTPDSPDRRKRYLYHQIVQMLQKNPPVPIAQIARTIGTSRSQIYQIKNFFRIFNQKNHLYAIYNILFFKFCPKLYSFVPNRVKMMSR